MSLRRRIYLWVNSMLRPFGVELVRIERDSQNNTTHVQSVPAETSPPGESSATLYAPSYTSSPLPPGAKDYLQENNPRYQELKAKYQAFEEPVSNPSLWTSQFQAGEIFLPYFRGDNAFIWQLRGMASKDVVELRYMLTAYYVQTIDQLGLLDKLDEDDLFGSYTFDFNKKITVSRDLLDSILEINFLERNLGISTWPEVTLLDIGAGYGRLAHRFVQALPNVKKYYCTDAVALSTFVCEYYLDYRGISDRAVVVPVDDLSNTLERDHIDIAVNVHSFSECTFESIRWWIELLVAHRVKYLMVVPNDGADLYSREIDETRIEYSELLQSSGYRLLTMQPKYLDPSVQQHGVHPAYHHLYALDL